MLTRLDDGLIEEAMPLPDKWVAFSDGLSEGRKLHDIPWCIGVYAIYVAGDLVYVGMSEVGIGSRLSIHFRRHRGVPSGVLWCQPLRRYVGRADVIVKVRCCRPSASARREEALISRLRPMGNKVVFRRGRRAHA